MNRYLRWNDAIAEHFLNPVMEASDSLGGESCSERAA